MAKTNKTEAIPEMTDLESIAREASPAITAPEPPRQKSVAAPPPKADDAAFCVYLGPSIHGIIQSGTVFKGNKEAALAALPLTIEKYPLIAKLIVTDKTLPEDRIKVKTPGNALYVFCKRLASGEK